MSGYLKETSTFIDQHQTVQLSRKLPYRFSGPPDLTTMAYLEAQQNNKKWKNLAILHSLPGQTARTSEVWWGSIDDVVIILQPQNLVTLQSLIWPWNPLFTKVV